MRHVMTLDNGRTGVTYELVLERVGDTWSASWHARTSHGPRGHIADADAYVAFKRACRAIEDIDADVIGVDWSFQEPLPPWFCA